MGKKLLAHNLAYHVQKDSAGHAFSRFTLLYINHMKLKHKARMGMTMGSNGFVRNPITINIVNNTNGFISDTELQNVMAGVHEQIVRDVAPAWGVECHLKITNTKPV